MEKIVEVYVKNKVTGYIKGEILKLELVEKGKKGIEKFEKLTNNLWDKIEKYIIEESKRDNVWIPNFIEEITEKALLEAIRVIRSEIDINKLVQEIFDIEKKENPNIF